MPSTSRAFVKASILYLVLGAIVGALLLLNRWLSLGSAIASLKVSHVQFLIGGWLTQLIMGVGWWLFPPLPIGLYAGQARAVRQGQAQRGSEPLFWMTFVTLNVGILLQAVFAPLHSWTKVDLFSVVSSLSAFFLLVAAIGFVTNTWRRIRQVGRRKQEKA